ncbi:hypothetical protein AJ80_09720 [Polytolypa hystricis UAMH7299]|uniref:Uncharacterized protein n=1 Tax=Polytolypa hystricis (strain UAMH7299) TaxID=1447883 RepID=A0A2B7WL56_POLH7|nr:hypothetical protein AJ80_09720 [Polytolypa hystricis UAMH7299]
MPPPSSQRGDIEPPPEFMHEATKGFLTGAVRFGSLSLLAHLILILPHPFHYTPPSSPPSSTTAAAPTNHRGPTPRKPAPFLYRPLISFSHSLAPISRVYRGLTPQFKVFIQLSAVTLGGCIWAEKRVAEYLEVMRRVKRAERMRTEEGE